MSPSPSVHAGADSSPFLVLWEDGEHALCRRQRGSGNRATGSVLAVRLIAEHPAPASINRLSHEYSLMSDLESAWAARPLELVRDQDRAMLLLEDPGGEPLSGLLGEPLEIGQFLRLAVGVAAALGQVHRRGLVHKDLKPAHILVDGVRGQVRLTGFGLASRLPRERQAPTPPQFIAGTLPYMAPEQTGRMNRSVDSRSDLYALGVTFYQMLTGSLPFDAADPMEWVHCHVARTPVPPNERLRNIPAPISHIVMKLLAKPAEERYQTAAGVERDLRRCLAAIEAKGRIEAFLPGYNDTSDRLLIPEKLYGRESEVNTLLAAFDRVARIGIPELVLVSGYSGIGKSSVVHELQRVLVPQRGLFASGKFDQRKRDIPYATLTQAFHGLIRLLLSKSNAELGGWRAALREALGPNGQLIVELIPELELIVGDQPPIADLPSKQAQSVFQNAVQRFVDVFARAEHPLALFLDDLQWLDAATLDLLEDLLTRSDLHHLLLIGAYRDNEVDATHPLMRKLEAIKSAGARIERITLEPLGREHIGQLIQDALRCEAALAAPLAQLVHDKTAGNPFFAIRFLSTLVEEGWLAFDPGAGRWSWDLERIRAKGYTENVVELMVSKLSRLPRETQATLQQMACLGNMAEVAMLSTVLEIPEAEVHAALWEAARQDLVERLDGSYKFIHDRVQEAAYALIPEGQRAQVHLGIGRLLASRTPSEQFGETIFEIVNQLNRGAVLISPRAERERLAEFNLRAATRAKASSAYVSALTYLRAGASLLGEDSWKRQPELTFALELNRAECEFLTGGLMEAEQRLEALSPYATDDAKRATVASLRVDLYTTLDRSDRAVGVCLTYLRSLGIEWSPHPTERDVRREYDQIWSQIGNRTIEELIDLPLMTDPAALRTLDVLTKVIPAALFTDANFLSLAICRAVNLSLEHGNSDGSCFAYVWLGVVGGPHFGDYKAAFRFGQLGYDLVDAHGLARFQARTYMCFGNLVVPWTKHVRAGRDLLRRAFDAANETGDLTFAGYSCQAISRNLLAAGDPLVDVQREAENGLNFARKIRFGLVTDVITSQHRLIRTLRGLTPEFGSFNDEDFDEPEFERHLASDTRLAAPECWYWVRKLQARFFAGDYAAAFDALLKAKQLLWTSPSHFEMAEYHFYAGLCRAALCDSAPAQQRQEHFDALAASYKELKTWAANCPENFENRAALVGAEIARLQGSELEAERLYGQAIRSARTNGFVHNEALGSELASRFHAARGLDDIAEMYLQKARNGYQRWGADAKVRQLESLHPNLRGEAPTPALRATIGTLVENLDLTTVIKVSQAVSSEIVLDRLLETLIRMAIQQAGAERGVLIVPTDGEPQIEVEATTCGETVLVQLRDAPASENVLPKSVLQYVMRTREAVILDDAAAQHPFAADPYIREHQARSILCLPLLTQAKLGAVLYLENNLAPSVFVPGRTAVLKLLASRAAIALENARLYRDVAAREAKIRRLVDANIIGIFIWELGGQIVEANDAFLRMLGYDREDLAAGRLDRPVLSPPEFREHDARTVTELRTTGIVPPFEKEYLRKDGSRVPILIGFAAFDEQRDQGVAFVVDLSERKRTEAEARENERRYHEVQMELAHANRIATIGQLTGSIAHEVNQPIAATVTNAQAGLCWLTGPSPNVEEARQAFARIVKDGRRAGEVISRIRGLVRKTPEHKDRLDINDAIREVIELTRGEAVKNRVVVQTRLADSLPLVYGDRVELQQVLLNLIINAVQAMSDVGMGARELLVTSEEAVSDGVLVTVADTGPGFAPANLDRLFEAFYTTKPGGLGLGLSICRSIVEAHGGRLWASANVAHGATLQFTVPVSPSGEA